MSRRIVVLFHESERGCSRDGYSIMRLMPIWRQDGHEVVEAFGVEKEIPADLLFVHVDLSEVPESYLAFAARYPASVNGRVRSIRKSGFAPYLLHRDDAWDGPVIVKSDRNYGGIPEAQRGIPRLDGGGMEPLFLSTMDYRIFEHLRLVPGRVFDSADLVVQRFLPEIEDELYHVRNYSFLGDWERCNRIGSRRPIVKEESRETKQSIKVDPRIVARRRELGLDFGKFDYVVRDGEAILLDVNKTIGGGQYHYRFGQLGGDREARARGLYSLFR